MAKPSIKERIDEKIEQIDKFMEELYSSIPQSLELEDYKKDFKLKAICEHYFEKIIEAVEDLAFLVMNHKEFKYPEYENEIFDILYKNKIISEILTKKLKNAKGMRNFIAHQYGKIDDVLVYHAIFEELEKDINEFLDNIKEVMR
ncbi:DUF86 domain-containing protein [Candidatus Pacearchaeota archaeon]|nr:hypothetical protein [uncultured archaeon]MBS3078861.1 DUF86 domain-containing protein [Candidatus Pacearchaeota archaeon]